MVVRHVGLAVKWHWPGVVVRSVVQPVVPAENRDWSGCVVRYVAKEGDQSTILSSEEEFRVAEWEFRVAEWEFRVAEWDEIVVDDEKTDLTGPIRSAEKAKL